MIVSIYDLKRLFLDELRKIPPSKELEYSLINITTSNYLSHYSQDNVIFHKFYNFKNLKLCEHEYGHFYRFINRLVLNSNLYFLSRLGSLEASNKASIAMYEQFYSYVKDNVFKVVYFDNSVFKIMVEMKADISSDVIFDYQINGSTSASSFCSFVSLRTSFEVTERFN